MSVRTVLLAAVTPLLEKNAMKTLSIDVPYVFSMGRLILLGFAAAMLRQIWHHGIAAWPDATLSIAIVLALPIMGALERVKPSEALGLAKAMLGRFGVGSTEPSRFDDHRID